MINFLAIHVNEQQFLLGIKPIIHSQKLYTWTVSGIFIKPPVFGGYLLYRLNKNLNLTQAQRNALGHIRQALVVMAYYKKLNKLNFKHYEN